MRKFVSLPSSFTGFAHPAIFPPMAARNAASLAQVYRKAEILFARLNMVRDRMKPWVALGTLDVEAWVETNCTQLPHFEANFATIKVRLPCCSGGVYHAAATCPPPTRRRVDEKRTSCLTCTRLTASPSTRRRSRPPSTACSK